MKGLLKKLFRCRHEYIFTTEAGILCCCIKCGEKIYLTQEMVNTAMAIDPRTRKLIGGLKNDSI